LTARTLLYLTPAVVLAACLAMVVLIVATKVARTRRERRTAALVAPYRIDLLAVSAGEDDDGSHRARLVGADGPSREALDGTMTTLLGKVRGAPADHLAEVLHAHGAIDRAMEELEHRSSVRRARAAHLLGLCHIHRALSGLAAALGDPTPEVRASAAHALGLIGNPAVARRVLDAVGTSRPIPAGAAADALEGMGTGISEALLDALHDPSPTVRTVAAQVSGEGSFTRSTPRLRELLTHDPDLTVREAVAGALAHLGRAEDVEVLARHTGNEQPTPLRRTCVTALGELGEPSAAPHLVALLDDTDPRLAELAATALLCLGALGREALGDRQGSAAETARVLAQLQRGERSPA
jgi:HEAT repeat protein